MPFWKDNMNENNMNENNSGRINPEALHIFDNPILMERSREFTRLMTWYRCAVMEVETKLRVLDQELSLEYDRNPIEYIETRIKSPASIMNKLKRNGWELSLESIEENLADIGGIRVVCSFQEDLFKLARMLGSQDDVSILTIKDYAKHPKPNGYRSLHLIVAVPIFLSTEKRYMKVEVQFRTIAMDFWASLEHKMRYKKDIKNQEEIGAKLKECADKIADLDYEMQLIRHMIESE